MSSNNLVKLAIWKLIKEIMMKGDVQDYIGEPVTQLEHSLQAADYAKINNMSSDVVVACLLHDIGHIVDDAVLTTIGIKRVEMDKWGTQNHELVGASILRELKFNDTICKLVEQHVNAKRYLVSTNKEYCDKLSIASINTLKFQGGLMNDVEIEEMKKNPLLNDIIFLRYAEDNAKIVGKKTSSLDDYTDMVMKCIDL